MADSKISALAAVTTVGNTDEYVVAVSGATKKITGANLKMGMDLDYGVGAAYGWKGWNFNGLLWGAPQALTSGQTRFGLVPHASGQVVTNIHAAVSVAAGTITLIKYGVYDTSGNRLAVTANATTAHDVAGWSTIALTTPWTAPSTGAYFYAALVVATTPGSLGAIASVTGKTLPGVTTNIGGTEGSQTDLDATATVSASGLLPWFGWS